MRQHVVNFSTARSHMLSESNIIFFSNYQTVFLSSLTTKDKVTARDLS